MKLKDLVLSKGIHYEVLSSDMWWLSHSFMSLILAFTCSAVYQIQIILFSYMIFHSKLLPGFSPVYRSHVLIVQDVTAAWLTPIGTTLSVFPAHAPHLATTSTNSYFSVIFEAMCFVLTILVLLNLIFLWWSFKQKYFLHHFVYATFFKIRLWSSRREKKFLRIQSVTSYLHQWYTHGISPYH